MHLKLSSAGSVGAGAKAGDAPTLWTDYALRTLIYLGVKGGGPATIAEIAESFDISRPHLMKVVNRLSVQGYIDTVRGRKGGIRLARPPARSVVGAVVRDTEEDLSVMGCLRPNPAFAGSRDAACCGARFARRRWRSWRFSTATRWPTFWRLIDASPIALGLAPATRLATKPNPAGAPGAGGA